MARVAGPIPWRVRIIDALAELGGHARYQDLYKRLGRDKPLTLNQRAGIRREIENHSSDSANYQIRRPDLFYRMGGPRSGHWGLRSKTDPDPDEAYYLEGERYLKEVSHITRNRGLVLEARAHHGCTCQACGFDFERFYGQFGKGFIEVHHLVPISNRALATSIKVSDVAVLCSNCHRMVHTAQPPLSLGELKDAIASASTASRRKR